MWEGTVASELASTNESFLRENVDQVSLKESSLLLDNNDSYDYDDPVDNS